MALSTSIFSGDAGDAASSSAGLDFRTANTAIVSKHGRKMRRRALLKRGLILLFILKWGELSVFGWANASSSVAD
jgi:hypothetical protein